MQSWYLHTSDEEVLYLAQREKLGTRIVMLGLAFMILALTINIPNVNAYTSYYCSRFNVYILDAYYTDMDQDSQENDVFVTLGFELGYSFIYDFIYEIRLTLPSGASYSYYVRVLAWSDVIIIRNLFFDHATESGDYTVDVFAVMISPDVVSAEASVVFDPPGGSEGGDPYFGVY